MSTSTEEKKRYVLEYIRSLVAIEEAIEPYKERALQGAEARATHRVPRAGLA
jgi:hypothetical protein